MGFGNTRCGNGGRAASQSLGPYLQVSQVPRAGLYTASRMKRYSRFITASGTCQLRETKAPLPVQPPTQVPAAAALPLAPMAPGLMSQSGWFQVLGTVPSEGRERPQPQRTTEWFGLDGTLKIPSRQGKGVPCLAPAKRRRGQTNPALRERVTPKGGFGQRGCSEPPQDGEHWHIKARRRTGRNDATCQQLGGMR